MCTCRPGTVETTPPKHVCQVERRHMDRRRNKPSGTCLSHCSANIKLLMSLTPNRFGEDICPLVFCFVLCPHGHWTVFYCIYISPSFVDMYIMYIVTWTRLHIFCTKCKFWTQRSTLTLNLRVNLNPAD